eukprot:936091-Prymnesium_polylepis.1
MGRAAQDERLSGRSCLLYAIESWKSCFVPPPARAEAQSRRIRNCRVLVAHVRSIWPTNLRCWQCTLQATSDCLLHTAHSPLSDVCCAVAVRGQPRSAVAVRAATGTAQPGSEQSVSGMVSRVD